MRLVCENNRLEDFLTDLQLESDVGDEPLMVARDAIWMFVEESPFSGKLFMLPCFACFARLFGQIRSSSNRVLGYNYTI